MASKDKENKSFQEKLKQFFRLNRGGPGTFRSRVDFCVSAELERELSPESPPPQRLKLVRDLCDNVLTNHLQDQHAVEKLWLCVADLIQTNQNKECRHLAFLFLRSLIQGQYEHLTILRKQFFRIVKEHDHPEDLQPRLELLQTLTDNGKDIKYLEEEIGQFMLQWMPTLTNPELVQEFLAILVNLVKYNATYLEEVISGFVNNVCFLCCYSAAPQVVMGCLQVLDAIVCYSIFPHEALRTLISALCRTVNIEQYCQASWKIMRCVLGTDLGHTALHIMCLALTSDAGGDCGLTRGAVFYLYMALWGAKRVTSLKCTPTQVLPSFLEALEGNQSVVTYEVILAMQSLVHKHGQELHEPAWDLIFSILLTIIKQLDTTKSPYPLTVAHLHETITAIEVLHETNHFNGSVDNLFNVIDMCGNSRPEASTLKLLNYMTSQIIPTNHEWMNILYRLVDRYCRKESRVNIRLKVLNTLQTIFEENRSSYEEELLDRVVLPNLQPCSTDADVTIRCASAKLLIELAMHCHSKRFTDLFDILEKLLNRPFELYVTTEPISLPPETDVSDIVTVATGIIKVFLHRLHRLPSAHAVRAYLTGLHHLELHYARPSLFEHHPIIRLKLLEWFLSARANSLYHIGFPQEAGGKVTYSPYICIEGGEHFAKSSHSPTPQTAHLAGAQNQISYVSIRKACKIIVTCLTQERDWGILQVVLKEIPHVMQNKALVLAKNSNDIDQLASAICSMIKPDQPLSYRSTGVKLTRTDFQISVLPALTCLAPYHTHLDSQSQQLIIKCLRFGLVMSPCSQQCISALTIFTLEMRDTMVKLLPEVLLDLSKISATVYIAIPILEFLSTLTRLPKVYASFVGDQYMSVFAILLPYTNPFKYNQYIVTLAHHVIAAWFLKCRLPFRRDFVEFIKQSLLNNIIKPFEQDKLKQDYQDLNQDSSSRKRSSSLTEQGSRRREIPTRSTLELMAPNEASNTFHMELTETCIDLMARYAYSPCISAPKRLQTAEFLLNGGQSMTWVLGHKVITITTSGCSQNALRQGLCERCQLLCKTHADSLQSPHTGPHSQCDGGEGLLTSDIKRYTKYTLQHSKSNETTNSSWSISDNVLYPPSNHNNIFVQSVSGNSSRQNSSEYNRSFSDAPPNSPKAFLEAENSQNSSHNFKLESIGSKQSSEEKHCGFSARLEKVLGGGSGGYGANLGCYNQDNARMQCFCWCGGWAEIHIRGPTGDVSWVMRIQNQVNFDSPSSDFPLSDVSSLFLASLGGNINYSNNVSVPPHLGSAASIASSGFADARSDVLSDGDPRSRSGSGGSQPDQLQKSNSDSVVTVAAVGGVTSTIMERKPPHASTHCIVPPSHMATVSATAVSAASAVSSRSHAITGPINIPGSPQRQNSSGTNTDDEDSNMQMIDNPHALLDEHGKSRHPVRRSNSSPEMSSSWKNPFHVREKMEALENRNNEEMNEANGNQFSDGFIEMKNSDEISTMTVQQTKKGVMKSLTKDMRVSCEAIPEEMSGSTPPHPLHQVHPHLMTYNSDPGSVQNDKNETGQVSATCSSEINLIKSSSDYQNSKTETTVAESNHRNNKPADLIIPNSNKNTGFNSSEKAPMSQDIVKLSSKPPHSPAPSSPRPTNRLQSSTSSSRSMLSSGNRNSSILSSETLRNAANLNLKFADNQSSQQNISLDDLPPLARSKRSNTISVMSPTRRKSYYKKDVDTAEYMRMSAKTVSRDNPSPKLKDSAPKVGASPAFVFLQLYHGLGGAGPNAEKPLLLTDKQHLRAVKNLDYTPPLEIYTIGVMYVGRGQHDNETKILKNEFGSIRYAEFLQDLGSLISIDDADSMGLFLNVEKGGRDGRFAYVWRDDIMQVHFHVATLMPNDEVTDSFCNEKKKHIGNDYVSIVYNESGEDFDIQTIKCHFNFACIIIEPLEHGTNKVSIKTKGELIEREFLNQTDPKIISDQNVALLARQLALHANLASVISRNLNPKSGVPTQYPSNWLERLRMIKRLRNNLLQEKQTSMKGSSSSGVSSYGTTPSSGDSRRPHMDDFTEYT